MKTNYTKIETTKKVYESPSIEKIRIDNEVSLVMGSGTSTPPNPGDAPTDPGSAWG